MNIYGNNYAKFRGGIYGKYNTMEKQGTDANNRLRHSSDAWHLATFDGSKNSFQNVIDSAVHKNFDNRSVKRQSLGKFMSSGKAFASSLDHSSEKNNGNSATSISSNHKDSDLYDNLSNVVAHRKKSKSKYMASVLKRLIKPKTPQSKRASPSPPPQAVQPPDHPVKIKMTISLTTATTAVRSATTLTAGSHPHQQMHTVQSTAPANPPSIMTPYTPSTAPSQPALHKKLSPKPSHHRQISSPSSSQTLLSVDCFITKEAATPRTNISLNPGKSLPFRFNSAPSTEHLGRRPLR